MSNSKATPIKDTIVPQKKKKKTQKILQNVNISFTPTTLMLHLIFIDTKFEKNTRHENTKQKQKQQKNKIFMHIIYNT